MINTMKFRIALGVDLGICENKEIAWEKICSAFTTHVVSPNKSGRYFVGGHFSGNVRRDEFLVHRTLLTLDIDDSGMTQSELELELLMKLDCAFVSYSTYSHTKAKAKIRVVIPLSRGVLPAEYRELSEKFVAELGIKCDPCSFKPNQLMYTPRCKDLSEVWSLKMDGECLDVEPLLSQAGVGVGSTDFDLVADVDADVEKAVEGMMAVVAAEPLDRSDAEVSAYLDAYPAWDLEYTDWVNVCMGLHHQYRGDDKGFELWFDWTNVGFDDPRCKYKRETRSELLKKYRSFDNGNAQREKPRTFATVMGAVNARGGLDAHVVRELQGVMIAGSEDFEELLVEASEIEDWGSYELLKDKLLRMSTVKLGTDLRSAIASELFTGIGKAKGMSKAEIKKAITPVGVSNGGLVREETEVPDWASVWIYIEATRLFHNVKRNYGISREAFNAKYDRMEECVASGMQASQLCLVVYKIKTVVDTIFWPGAGQIVMFEGKPMLNSYRKNGVRPCATLEGEEGGEEGGEGGDREGLEVVAMFLKHLEHLIDNEVEREIVLHWMIFVVQNPGKRLNWSLILQGTQGSGKSYIGNVMALLLGSNVQSLDTATISGRFTSWATGAILNIVEEIRISGTNRWAIMDRIKPYITNDQILCEKKGRDVLTLPNFTSYLLLTNHKDAVPLDDEDRRYCVVYSRLQTSEQLHEYFGGAEKVEEYFDKLFTMTKARPDAIARYFMDYKLPSSFKPFGRAPKTEAKSQMIDLAVSEVRQEVEDLLSRFADELITDEFIDVTHFNDVALLNGEPVPKTRALSSVLLDMGFKPIKGGFFRVYNPDRKHRVWVKEGITDEFAIEKVKEVLKEKRLV
jgi:hypothetical protein